ncbi:MAG: hypothetical protein GYB31_00185 [Bacteroidetes bacterium]|nr:hypothetical protein [Bacteroidota bacterium]
MAKRFILIFCLFIFVFSGTFSQQSQLGSPSVTNFSRTDYHAGTQNWNILQDSRGIMYFGNNKGLLEFDGTNWQIFPVPNRTIVRSCAIAEDDKMYIGAQDELGVIDSDVFGKTRYQSLTHLIPDSLKSFEDIWSVFTRPDGIYFCSKKAIFIYAEDRMEVLKPQKSEFENFYEAGDQIYVQDTKRGFFQIKEKKLQLISDNPLFSSERIVAVLEHPDYELLLVSQNSGFYQLEGAVVSPWLVASTNFLLENKAYCAIRLSNGFMAIGTIQNGLLIVNQQGEIIRHVNDKRGLQNNTVLTLCEDKQHNLWLGLDNGIDYVEINAPFSLLQSEYGIEGTGYAAYIDDQTIYLGTNQGIYYADWPPKQGVFEINAFRPINNAKGQVWTLDTIDNSLILGQHRGSSVIMNRQVQPFSSIQGAWKFMPLQAHPGYIIQGTYTGLHLYKYSPKGGSESWEFVRQLEGFNESARVMEQDEFGNIWVSHPYKGLYKIELQKDLSGISNINFYNKGHGLPVDLFVNVAKIRNELIFTTPKGVYKYDASSDRFISHPEFDAIFGEDATVHRLLEDQFGNIWFSVGAEFGLLKVQEKGVFNKLDQIYFNQIQEDLVDGFEFVYAHDKENIFIGTEKGFVHYNPTQNKDFDFVFETLIRKVSTITAKDSVLFQENRFVNYADTLLKFKHKQNDFRFSYSVPYFEKIDQIAYQFKLEGFDNAWSSWSSRAEKDYTNLAPGDYQFKVKARNAYGQLSKESVFSFKIYPPWYLSLAAKGAYFLLTALGLFALMRFFIKREEKRTEALKNKQRETLRQKEEEYKKEAEKSEDAIIKLKNEKLQSDIDLKTSQLASATMHLVQKSEVLLKIKGELRQILKSLPSESRRKIEQINRAIEADIRLDNNWEQFEIYFDQVHKNFFKRLRERFPELTPKDQKLCAYLRMNLSTKEIAPLMNISVRGVEISRYRLRKKLDLDSDTNLVSFMLEI